MMGVDMMSCEDGVFSTIVEDGSIVLCHGRYIKQAFNTEDFVCVASDVLSTQYCFVLLSYESFDIKSLNVVLFYCFTFIFLNIYACLPVS